MFVRIFPLQTSLRNTDGTVYQPVNSPREVHEIWQQMQLPDNSPEGTTALSCNRRTASATQTCVRWRMRHFAPLNTTLPTRSERLTRPTINCVPKGEVIRKEFCLARQTKQQTFLWEAERKCVSVTYALRQKETRQHRWKTYDVGRILQITEYNSVNPLNAELNPICHFLELFGAHHIFHVSGLRVKPCGILILKLTNLLTYLLTYSMVQSPHWEANWFAAGQEIPRILWNPKVH